MTTKATREAWWTIRFVIAWIHDWRIGPVAGNENAPILKPELTARQLRNVAASILRLADQIHKDRPTGDQ